MMMVYSLINVPYASLLGVMSANPQVRTEFSSYRMTFAFGGSILVLFLIEPLVDIFSKMKNNGEYTRYRFRLANGCSRICDYG